MASDRTLRPPAATAGASDSQPALAGKEGVQRSASRDEHARAALRPLADGERPAALLVAVAVAVALAGAVLVGTLTVHDLSRRGGSLPGGLFLAGVLLALAHGMYRRRYWAVLGFEALLGFQIVVTSLALVVAETWLAAGLCALDILLAGWLFWKLVRVMGRVQATERLQATERTQAAERTQATEGRRAQTQTDTDEALR